MVPRSGNALLDAISRREREKFIAACERVEMTLGETVCKPGEPIQHVYFPLSSYISLITPPGASESLEVGLVGREGSFGLTVLLDIDDLFAARPDAGKRLGAANFRSNSCGGARKATLSCTRSSTVTSTY